MSVSMKKIVSVILSIALVLTYSMSSISLIKAEEVIVPEYEIYVKGQDEKVKLELEMLYKKSGSDEERKEAKAKLKEQLKNIDESKYDWDNIEEENGSKYDVDFYSGKDGFSIFMSVNNLDNGNDMLRNLFVAEMNKLIKIERKSNPNSETIEEPIVEHIMGTEYSNPIYRTINEKKSEYDKERNSKVYSGFMNKNMDKYLQGGVYGVKVFIKDTYKDNENIGIYYTIDGSEPEIGKNNTAEINRIVRNNEKDYEIIDYEYNDQERFNGYSIIFAKNKEAIKSWIKSLGDSINVNELDFPKELEGGGNLVVKIRAINKETK